MPKQQWCVIATGLVDGVCPHSMPRFRQLQVQKVKEHQEGMCETERQHVDGASAVSINSFFRCHGGLELPKRASQAARSS